MAFFFYTNSSLLTSLAFSSSLTRYANFFKSYILLLVSTIASCKVLMRGFYQKLKILKKVHEYTLFISILNRLFI